MAGFGSSHPGPGVRSAAASMAGAARVVDSSWSAWASTVLAGSPVARKYDNVFPGDSAAPPPLLVELHQHVLEWLGASGSETLAASISGFIANSVSPSTWSAYTSAFKRFVSFCKSECLDFLPATEPTVLRYALFLAEEGLIQAEGSQSYFSAINKFHELLGFAPPAKGRLLAAFRAGWVRVQHSVVSLEGEGDAREPTLPAAVALSMYNLLPLVPRDSADYTALVYSVVAFRTFLRPSTLVSIYWSEFLGIDGRFTLRFKAGVWKDAHGKGLSAERTPSLDVTDLPFLRDALRWVVQTSGGGQFLGFRSVQSGNAAFQRALILARPDLAGVFSQYSCRRGGTSAAYAVGVPLDVLESMGGWAVGSKAMRSHYLDRSIGYSEAAKFFFGSLVPGRAPPLFGATYFG